MVNCVKCKKEFSEGKHLDCIDKWLCKDCYDKWLIWYRSQRGTNEGTIISIWVELWDMFLHGEPFIFR